MEKKLAGRIESIAFPNPAILAEYKAVDVELLRTIIASVEREQRHRHWRECAPEWTARLGVLCGLMIGLAGLVTAGYLAAIGSPVPGAVLGAADLLGLVGVFIYGSRQQPAETRLSSSNPSKLRSMATNETPVDEKAVR